MIYNVIVVGLGFFALGFGAAWLMPTSWDPADKKRKVFRILGVGGAITALIAANIFVLTHLFQNVH